MITEIGTDSRHQILRAAAALFQRNGYDATSIQDICTALSLSKGALYHHFRSKDEILFHIMGHAMAITEARVIAPVLAMTEAHGGATLAESRLKALIRLHVETVLGVRDREITVMLHENHPLAADFRAQINDRKKNYVRFVEGIVAEVQQERGSSTISPRAAAFAVLGLINWIYQWYKPGGPISEEELVRQYTEMVFGGAFGK